jgi:uncharacterized protein
MQQKAKHDIWSHDMQIVKQDAAGIEQITYAGELAARHGNLAVIRARWQHGARDLGYVTFEQEDRFTEYFYTNQWFNIMRVGTAADDALKGWYCNITRPATITADTIIYEDLLLDVWVGADSTCLVLDEDEFAAATLDEVSLRGAEQGLAEVQRWVQARLGPFAELH